MFADERGVDDELIGRTAVGLGLLTAAQVQELLATDHGEQPPGAIYLSKGLLTGSQLNFVLAAYRFKRERIPERRFGDMVVERGWATPEQIAHLLNVQRLLFTRKRKIVLLGDLLVHEGLLTPEQRDGLTSAQPQVGPGPAVEPVQVAVSADRMRATVAPVEGAPRPTPEAVELTLHRHGITVGLDRSAIAAFSAGRTAPGEPVVVASGIPARPGRDAAVEYLFDLAPLKAGRQHEDGTIDFRDRGELPQVASGTLLARKIPAQAGEPGQDLFGATLGPAPPRDRHLLVGDGATLEEDGLGVVATTDGFPSVTAAGKIAVFPEYRIDGDIDYHTGHIDFRGHVIASGTVRNGFRVTCGQLTAGEAEGATIVAQGDVLIRGGIINTHVRAEGSVTAKYLHNANLEVMGDVLIEREVVDSRVESGGAFRGERCTLLGSRVAAKQGISVKAVGSEVSGPCHLVLGVDERVAHELERLEAQRQAYRDTAEAGTARAAAIERQHDETERAIGELAQQQDQAMVHRRSLQQHGKGDELAAAEAAISELSGRLDGLFAAQERLAAEQEEAQAAVTLAKADEAAVTTEIEALREWSSEHPGQPELKVSGSLFAGTFLVAPHAELRIRGERKRVWFRERAITTEGGQTQWRLEPVT